MEKYIFKELGEKTKKERAGWNSGREAGGEKDALERRDLLKSHETHRRGKIIKMTCLKDETLLKDVKRTLKIRSMQVDHGAKWKDGEVICKGINAPGCFCFSFFPFPWL